MREVVDYLDEVGIAYKKFGEHHHVREGWVGLDCPFCGPNSNRYHLGLNVRTLYLHCWRCGRTDPKETLNLLGLNSRKFYSYRSEIVSEPLEGYNPTSNAEKRLLEAASSGCRRTLKEPAGRGPLKSIHRDYLKSRGFRPSSLVGLWSLEGIGLASKLSWRIYIPIMLHGQRVSWTTRAVGERATQRYISADPGSEIIPHKQLLYGLDLCAHSVIIVEGPSDAWKIGPGAAAVFGTDFTIGQAKLLASIPKRCVCFDSEPEAQNKARELGRLLSSFPGSTTVVELDAPDPGSASEREIQRLRKCAHLT